jgi:hypothetical protein
LRPVGDHVQVAVQRRRTREPDRLWTVGRLCRRSGPRHVRLGDCRIAVGEHDHPTHEIAVERVAVKYHHRHGEQSAFEGGDALIDHDNEVVSRLDEVERFDVRIASG